MFRRRPAASRPLAPPLRRLLRPSGPPPPPMSPTVLEAHRRANHWMDSGAYSQAAESFERLARQAAQMSRPRQAANLFLKAGHALVLAGQLTEGLKLAQEGLNLLAHAKDWEAFDRLSARAVGELELSGQKDAGRQLSEWVRLQRKEQPAPAVNEPSSPSVRFPGQCPSCGAPVRPGEVEWFDETTAGCAYCGSILQAQN